MDICILSQKLKPWGSWMSFPWTWSNIHIVTALRILQSHWCLWPEGHLFNTLGGNSWRWNRRAPPIHQDHQQLAQAQASLGLPRWYDSSGWRRKAADSLYIRKATKALEAVLRSSYGLPEAKGNKQNTKFVVLENKSNTWKNRLEKGRRPLGFYIYGMRCGSSAQRSVT